MKLRLCAVPGRMLPAHNAGARPTFIGIVTKYDATTKSFDFTEKMAEPHEIECDITERPYYARAAMLGDILPADESTARELGVPFPTVAPKAPAKPSKE